MTLNFIARSLQVNGKPVNLTSTELRIIEAFFLSPETLFSRDHLIDKLYSSDDEIEERTIDSHIKRVRIKLNQAQAGLGETINTFYGEGYKFFPPSGNNSPHIKQFGSFAIDLAEQEVRIDDKIIDVTMNEFMLLKTFALAYPNSVSREDLVKQLSKFGREASPDTVDRVLYSAVRNLGLYHPGFNKFIIPTAEGNRFIMNLSHLDERAARQVEHDIITLGTIKINRTLSTMAIRTQSFDVTSHEIKIMEGLISKFPARISNQELIDYVYGEGGKLFNLNNHLNKLRDKIREANNGVDLIQSRRGMGYVLDIQSERVLAKFEDKIETVTVGPWIIDRTRQLVSYSAHDSKKSIAVPFNKSQFLVFNFIVAAYPHPVDKNSLMKAVYGETAIDKDSSLNSTYAQMKGVLKKTLGDYRGGFRKLSEGSIIRLDLDIDDISKNIIDDSSIKEVGPWAINETLHMFLFDGDPIDVNETEYSLLKTFIETYPKPIKTKDLALRHFDGQQASLNTCLTLLRKKISETYKITEPFIQNKRGVGYVMVANRDELADEQIQSMNIVQIGNVSVNMDVGQLSFDNKTIELNAAELFTLRVLTKATKPITAELLSAFSKAANQNRETMSMYQAVRSLEDKMTQAGFEGEFIDRRRNAGFFLSAKRAEIIANSEIQIVCGMNLNKTLFEISFKGKVVSLTPSQFLVIETLAQNPRIPLSIEDLSKLSDDDGNPYAEATLIFAKNQIKQKLVSAGLDGDDASIISNKSGVGYFLTAMADNLDPSRINGKRATSITDQKTISAGVLSINTITDSVEYEGLKLEGVSGKALDVLVLMTQRHGDFITNTELSQHFFGNTDPENIAQVERGIHSLRHMINKTVDGLGQSLIMKVGDKGYGLTLSLEEREGLLVKAGVKTPVKNIPIAIQKPKGKAVKGFADTNVENTVPQERGSLAEQLQRALNLSIDN